MSSDTLDTLLAKQAITEKLVDYCRAMDRIDDELGRSVFHPESTADYGTMFQGTGYGFIDFAHDSHVRMLAQAHQLGNIRIHVEGDRAGSEALVTARLRFESATGHICETRSHGRYVDWWCKHAGAWVIRHRKYLHVFDETKIVPPASYDTAGARDLSDPSYAALSLRDPA